MADEVSNAPAQSAGIPPVEDSDIKGFRASDRGEDSPKDSKTDKRDGSQPRDEAKEKGPGPWTQKLVDAGLDDPRFDEFLRTQVQPYITQLEQGGGEAGPGMWDGDTELEQAAFDLIQELTTNPAQAYAELGQILGMDQGDSDTPTDEAPTADVEDDATEEDPRLQYVNDLMRRDEEQRQDAEYKEFMDTLSKRVPGFDPDLYTLAFIASDGDLDRAWGAYMKYHKDPVPEASAPSVLGDEGGSAPPTEPKHESIGDAVSGFLAEERARRSRA